MKIKALGYIGLESTDVAKWEHFGTQVIGMQKAAMPDDGNVYLKMDAYSYRLFAYPGETDQIGVAGWEVETKEDFDEAVAELKAADIDFEVGTKQECEARQRTFYRGKACRHRRREQP